MSLTYRGNIVLDMHINFDDKYPTLKLIELDANAKEEIHTYFSVHNVQIEETLDMGSPTFDMSFNSLVPIRRERHKL